MPACAEATETYLNTHADIFMEQYLRAPPVISTGVDVTDSNPPRESDYDTEALDPSATDAFQRLIDAIDNPPATPLEIDTRISYSHIVREQVKSKKSGVF